MAVDDSFRVAGCARGVAHRCGSIFIELRPLNAFRLTGNKCFVVNCRLQFARGLRSLAHDHILLDRFELICNAL